MSSARAVGEFKNHLRAKKRLMETHASSESKLSRWNHNHLTSSNSNATPCFAFDKPDASLQFQPTELPDSNRQLETIRNRRNPLRIKQIAFSNRPKKPKLDSGLSNPPASQHKNKNGLRPELASWYFLPGHTKKGRVSVHD